MPEIASAAQVSRGRPWFANPVFSEEYRAIVNTLIQNRKSAGVSQRDFAARLGRSPSHIARIEQGQRRVDVFELYLMAVCLGQDPTDFFMRVCKSIGAVRSTAR